MPSLENATPSSPNFLLVYISRLRGRGGKVRGSSYQLRWVETEKSLKLCLFAHSQAPPRLKYSDIALSWIGAFIAICILAVIHFEVSWGACGV